jgi:hypothetical protein
MGPPFLSKRASAMTNAQSTLAATEDNQYPAPAATNSPGSDKSYPICANVSAYFGSLKRRTLHEAERYTVGQFIEYEKRDVNPKSAGEGLFACGESALGTASARSYRLVVCD